MRQAPRCKWMLKDYWPGLSGFNSWNKFGLSCGFGGWARTGHRCLTTMVLINGPVSDIFSQSGVTCQGLLLSPLWLALAEAIRTQRGLFGVWRISLYTDGILLFITNLDNSTHQSIKVWLTNSRATLRFHWDFSKDVESHSSYADVKGIAKETTDWTIQGFYSGRLCHCSLSETQAKKKMLFFWTFHPASIQFKANIQTLYLPNFSKRKSQKLLNSFFFFLLKKHSLCLTWAPWYLWRCQMGRFVWCS